MVSMQVRHIIMIISGMMNFSGTNGVHGFIN